MDEISYNAHKKQKNSSFKEHQEHAYVVKLIVPQLVYLKFIYKMDEI